VHIPICCILFIIIVQLLGWKGQHLTETVSFLSTFIINCQMSLKIIVCLINLIIGLSLGIKSVCCLGQQN